jgi:Bacterial PH domain
VRTATAEHGAVELDGWAFRWIVWLLLVPVALVAGGFALVLPLPWAIAVVVAGLALVALAAFRAARVSVTIGSDSVRVVNLLRTYEIGWPEVERLVVSGGSMLEEGISRGIRLDLRDGRHVLCQASTGYVPWARAALDAFRPHAARWGVPIDDDAA